MRSATRARLLLALGATIAVLASCESRENNHLGVVLIEDQGEFKAVRLLEIETPDTTHNYQLSTPPTGAGATGTLVAGARAGLLARGIARFPVASFPPAGTTVDSAFVEWHVRDGFGPTSPLLLLVHRVTADWAEDLADSFPSFDAQPLDTLVVPIAAGVLDTLRVSIGSLVQTWVDSSQTNFGIALVPAAGADAEAEFTTREVGTGAQILIHTTVDGGVATTTLAPSADTFLLETTPAYVSPVGTPPGRLTLARGLPARILLKFSIPDLGERVTINRAELVVHIDGAASSTNTFEFGVERVTAEPWTDATTSAEGLLFGVTSVTADTDSAALAMTSVVDALLDQENHGFQLRASLELGDTDFLRLHGGDTEVAGKEPSLRIWYTPGSGTEDTP